MTFKVKIPVKLPEQDAWRLVLGIRNDNPDRVYAVLREHLWRNKYMVALELGKLSVVLAGERDWRS